MGRLEDAIKNKANAMVENAKQKAKDATLGNLKKAGKAPGHLFRKLTEPRVVKSTKMDPALTAQPLDVNEWETYDIRKAQKQVEAVLAVVDALEDSNGEVTAKVRVQMAKHPKKFKIEKHRRHGLMLEVKCANSAEVTVVGGSMAELTEEKGAAVTNVQLDPVKKIVIIFFGL